MNVNITIESILKIIEIDSLMRLQLQVNVSWMDTALNYKNLRKDENLNPINLQQRRSIWLPSLKFSSAMDKYVATFTDELSTGIIQLLPNATSQIAALMEVQNHEKYRGNEG